MFIGKTALILNDNNEFISPATNIESLYYELATVDNSTITVRKKPVTKHMDILFYVHDTSSYTITNDDANILNLKFGTNFKNLSATYNSLHGNIDYNDAIDISNLFYTYTTPVQSAIDEYDYFSVDTSYKDLHKAFNSYYTVATLNLTKEDALNYIDEKLTEKYNEINDAFSPERLEMNNEELKIAILSSNSQEVSSYFNIINSSLSIIWEKYEEYKNSEHIHSYDEDEQLLSNKLIIGDLYEEPYKNDNTQISTDISVYLMAKSSSTFFEDAIAIQNGIVDYTTIIKYTYTLKFKNIGNIYYSGKVLYVKDQYNNESNYEFRYCTNANGKYAFGGDTNIYNSITSKNNKFINGTILYTEDKHASCVKDTVDTSKMYNKNELETFYIRTNTPELIYTNNTGNDISLAINVNSNVYNYNYSKISELYFSFITTSLNVDTLQYLQTNANTIAFIYNGITYTALQLKLQGIHEFAIMQDTTNIINMSAGESLYLWLGLKDDWQPISYMIGSTMSANDNLIFLYQYDDEETGEVYFYPLEYTLTQTSIVNNTVKDSSKVIIIGSANTINNSSVYIKGYNNNIQNSSYINVFGTNNTILNSSYVTINGNYNICKNDTSCKIKGSNNDIIYVYNASTTCYSNTYIQDSSMKILNASYCTIRLSNNVSCLNIENEEICLCNNAIISNSSCNNHVNNITEKYSNTYNNCDYNCSTITCDNTYNMKIANTSSNTFIDRDNYRIVGYILPASIDNLYNLKPTRIQYVTANGSNGYDDKQFKDTFNDYSIYSSSTNTATNSMHIAGYIIYFSIDPTIKNYILPNNTIQNVSAYLTDTTHIHEKVGILDVSNNTIIYCAGWYKSGLKVGDFNKTHILHLLDIYYDYLDRRMHTYVLINASLYNSI